jgi:hypothetical protein
MAAALAGMTSPTGSSQYQPHLQGPQRVLGTLSSASQDIGLQSTSRDSVGSLGSAQSPGYFNAAVSVTSASMGSRGEAGFSYEPRRTSPPLSLGTARTHGETTGAEESKQLPSPLSPAADSYAAFAGKLGLLSEASSPTQQQQQQQQPQQQQQLSQSQSQSQSQQQSQQQQQPQSQQPSPNGNLTIDQIQRQLLHPEGQHMHRESSTSPSPTGPSRSPAPGQGPGAGAGPGAGSFDSGESEEGGLHVSTRHTYATRTGQYYPM